MAKMRSPNYPAIGLSQAINYVRKLWEKEKRTSVSPDVAAKALGYKALNGPSRTAISALRKYGLVEEGKSGVRVSDLAMTILHGQKNSPEWQKAIQEAAFRPDIFREIYTDFADASDDALRSHLLQREFSPSGAHQFIAAFRDTLALVKTLDPVYIKDKEAQEEEKMPNGLEGQTAEISKGQTGRPVTRIFSWPLSKDMSAELRITGGDIKASHIEMLRQYLELAKSALASESG
jgi:hypothetical protein